MSGNEAVVQAAIQKPYQVYQDSSHPDTKIIYKPFVLPHPFDRSFLRVAIKYRKPRFGGLKGYVATAFACFNIKQGDILIWEEP